MKARRPNFQRVKIHRNYTVEDVATLLDKHKNTVRAWIKEGLPTCDDRRPILILGCELRQFLIARRSRNKSPCAPGEIYCVRCRSPRKPAGRMADYRPVTATAGNLIGICPVCDALMYRRASLAKIGRVRGDLDITFPEAGRRIGDTALPFPDCDFTNQGAHHDNAQPRK